MLCLRSVWGAAEIFPIFQFWSRKNQVQHNQVQVQLQASSSSSFSTINFAKNSFKNIITLFFSADCSSFCFVRPNYLFKRTPRVTYKIPPLQSSGFNQYMPLTDIITHNPFYNKSSEIRCSVSGGYCEKIIVLLTELIMLIFLHTEFLSWCFER